MPIDVSLQLLVAYPATVDLWPGQFVDLVEKVRSDPDEMTAWSVLADWLQEHGEYGMEDACRYVVKRQGISLKSSTVPHFWFDGLPKSVTACQDGNGSAPTLPGLIAVLANTLRKQREEGS